ncbi:TP53 regulating kinase, partial [Physocladia obscura]
ISRKIGEGLGKLHNADIIHGDLTTSNLMLRAESLSLVFIDFGLSFVSSLAEDKAVDLYVLERALASTHPQSHVLLEEILKSYFKTTRDSKNIRKKLDEEMKVAPTELRGMHIYTARQLVANAGREMIAGAGGVGVGGKQLTGADLAGRLQRVRLVVGHSHAAAHLFATNELPRLFHAASALPQPLECLAVPAPSDAPDARSLLDLVLRDGSSKSVAIDACKSPTDILVKLIAAIS